MVPFLDLRAGSCVKFVLLTGFAVASCAPQSHAQQPVPGLRPGNAPKTIVYQHIFKHIEYLEDRAAQVERSGADAKPLREYYKLSAGLNEREDAALKNIARGCNVAVDAQDQRAQAIIKAIRSRHPDGRLAPGEKAPAVPNELAALQAARNGLIQNAIDQIKAAFGDERFERFEQFVQTRVSPKVSWTPVVVSPPAQQ